MMMMMKSCTHSHAMTGCVPAVMVSSSAQATSSACRMPLYRMMFFSALYNLHQHVYAHARMSFAPEQQAVSMGHQGV